MGFEQLALECVFRFKPWIEYMKFLSHCLFRRGSVALSSNIC